MRGQPPAETGAIADAITGLSRLACDLGDVLDALDINPLICPPSGAVAADVLLVPAARGPRRLSLRAGNSGRHLAVTPVSGHRSDGPAVAPLDHPPRVPHSQRDDRLHRVDADRAGEDTGVGHEQPGHAVELPEAADHPAPGVLAHPCGAHQVDREQLEGSLGHRPGQQAR